MKDSQTVYFEELALELNDKTILVDIDGTLLPDGEVECEQNVKTALLSLAKENKVYLCTNSRVSWRNDLLASKFCVPILRTVYRKPDPRIAKILNGKKEERVVIGDKFLTDHVFAALIGAQFIRVKRKRSGHERLIIRFINIIDDLAYKLFSLF